MQSASSRIRTCVTVSISYDDNHYTKGSSNFLNQFIYLCSNISSAESDVNEQIGKA